MRRRANINEHVFDVLETPEQFYWLGFLLADGCVTSRESRPVVALGLSQRDSAHVERFRQFISSGHRLEVARGACALGVVAPHMAARLMELGIEPRKSGREQASQELSGSRDFWRGVLDGDGWIKYHRNGWGEVGLCGSEVLCGQFLSYVRTFVRTDASVKKAPKANCWSIRLRGYHAVTVMRVLYEGCPVALSRKAVEAKAAVEAFKERGHQKGKLTDEQVREIRSRYRPRIYSYARLAVENAVSELVIERIVKGRAYRRVT